MSDHSDLIAEARGLIMGATFWTADGRTLPQKEHLIARLSAALEAAEAKIAAVRALQRYFVAFGNDATPAVNGSYVFYEDLIRALNGDGATKGESI